MIAPRRAMYRRKREDRGGEDVGKPRRVNRSRIKFPCEDKAERGSLIV
jgi:hypothetical protein